MNKTKINRSNRPFLEDFSIGEINNYLDMFLIISKEYCQIPFSYDIIEGIINQIRKGEYPGLFYSNKIMKLLSYSDFTNLFNTYIKENDLKKYSFYNCATILNKLLSELRRLDSGEKINESILNVIRKLQSTKEIDNSKKEIKDLTTFTKNDVDKVLDEICPDKKQNKRFRYRREVDKKVSIYIEEEKRLKSFELIKRILNITILKNEKGEYFLRDYLKKPLIKVDLLRGISFIQNQNGKNVKLTIKIEINKGKEEIIMELEDINS